jgi:uncharacterized protein YdcH (DUF465 family)
MSLTSFKIVKLVKSLMMKSAVVQIEIEEETKKRNPDWMRVVMLKKQRLMIKDKIHQIRTRRVPRLAKSFA